MTRFQAAVEKARMAAIHQFNRGRKQPVDYEVGDHVWYLATETADKLQPRWYGPVPITRKRQRKYWITMANGAEKECHEDHLRPSAQTTGGEALPLYFARPNYSRKKEDERKTQPIVEVTDVRVNTRGQQEWKARRADTREFIWEPLTSFLGTPLPVWQSYNRTHKVKVDLDKMPRA
jgi:hypothetical protein